MKRRRPIVLSLIAVLCASIFPGTSASETPSGSARRAAAIRAYWTPERMAHARPAEVTLTKDHARALGIDTSYRSALQIGSSFSSHEVTDPSAPGYRTHGKVFFTSAEGFDYVCSGTVVTSSNESTIATAGHCVYEPSDSTYMTNWIFVPAYRNGNAPFGEWVATDLWTTTGWADNNDFRYDVAFARVESNGATIEDTVGSRDIAFNLSAFQAVDAIGYPAASPFNGRKMWVCETEVDHREGGGQVAPLGIGCDMTGGSSGGGWVIEDSTVNSVVSFSIVGIPDILYGPYFGTVAEDLYEEATGDNAPTPTPQPTPTPTDPPGPGPDPDPDPDPDPEPPTTHEMSLTLKLRGHLKAKGKLKAIDGYLPCTRNAPVEIYRLNRYDVGIYVSETFTNDRGRYRLRIRDRRGTYFAYSPAGYVSQSDTCGDALSNSALHR